MDMFVWSPSDTLGILREVMHHKLKVERECSYIRTSIGYPRRGSLRMQIFMVVVQHGDGDQKSNGK